MSGLELLHAAGTAVLQAAGLLALAPLLRGLIKKIKASLQGRQGPPLLQGYFDIAKLLRKEPVRSDVASWVFAFGPRASFATAVAAALLVPVLVTRAPFERAGGVLVFVGLLALGRFALAAAALDSGSPFGGMGSSRDMTIGALAEPGLLLALFTVGLSVGSLDLGALVRNALTRPPALHPSELLAAAALFIVFLAEAGRLPVDNPATHLELTMIHEAMVLEYSGPDLALVEWGAALKELLFATLLIDLFLPFGMAGEATPAGLALALGSYAAKLAVFAVAVALVESTNAKLRLFRVPELMATSLGLGFLALALRFL